MISIHTTPKAGRPPRRPAGTHLVASVDVEWTKNYRIPNGNVPFCYSVAYLLVPSSGRFRPSDLPVLVSSQYVESANETGELVRAAAAEISSALQRADLVVGHQLSSDLAVLTAAGTLRGAPTDCLTALHYAPNGSREKVHAEPPEDRSTQSGNLSATRTSAAWRTSGFCY